jgi:hypothetical protein
MYSCKNIEINITNLYRYVFTGVKKKAYTQHVAKCRVFKFCRRAYINHWALKVNGQEIYVGEL